MPSAPSRYEVEHLHRLMMQASADASQLDRKLQEERKGDGLSASLRNWQDSADALLGAVERARTGLLRGGTPGNQLDRIRDRLVEIKDRSKRFDVDQDLDACVQHWKALGLEFGQLSGVHRDPLVRLLQGRQARVDQATSFLSSARQTGGVAPEKHAKIRSLLEQRDRAREKYQRLRQKYLEAERDHQLGERQKAMQQVSAELPLKKAPLPNLAAAAKKGPVLVRLPGPKPVAAPASRPAGSIAPRMLTPMQLPLPRGPQASAGPGRTAGPARVSLERIERTAGYPTGMDGIGRGAQSAALWFRAENLPAAPSIQGTTSLQLGCSVRLQVVPSVQLFSGAAGTPLRGKLSLALTSSGGRLGPVSPHSALEAARGAARAGGRQVARGLGVLGSQLESAIAGLLEDAADKIFRRAQANAAQHRLPQRGSQQRGSATEQQLSRFGSALGSILQAARALRGAAAGNQRLLAHLDRDHHHRDSVAGRLEQTLSHLATASHRTLTDPTAGELRSHLARMDSILARLRGKGGPELHDGAREIGQILQRMGSIASSRGGAQHLHQFRKLIDERRGQLQKIAGESHRTQAAEALKPKGRLPQMPSAQVLGEKQLQALRRQVPGIDKLLRNASHAQLVAELGKAEKGALGALGSRMQAARRGGLGSGSLAGGSPGLGAAHLGGFGGGHRAGALGALSGAGGLGKVLEKQLHHQLQRSRPTDAGKLLAGLHKAPAGTPLHELAKKAEARRKQLASRHAGRRGPSPSQITAAALLDVVKEHPRGRSLAHHLAPGGVLRSLCEAAQRGHGLPISAMAQHYLASRGHSHIFNAVATVNSLLKQGYKPHRWGLGSIGHFVSSHVSSALSAVSNTVTSATNSLGSFARSTFDTARAGVSSLGNAALAAGRTVAGGVGSAIQRGVGAASDFGQRAAGFIGSSARGLWNAARSAGQGAWSFARGAADLAFAGVRQGARTLGSVAQAGLAAAHSGSAWVQNRAGQAALWLGERAGAAANWARARTAGAAAWMGERVHSGLEWAGKVGVVGGRMIRTGLSYARRAAEFTPFGLAARAGQWAAGGGLARVWQGTRHLAGKAWGGIKTAYNATSKFLQSPAGQLLVTGLSLAASFIPGGMLVKGVIGAGIGAITAISEGRGWKGILAGAAGGALTGALPFLKIGPLAKVGVGALQGGITALASGGNLKDALKGAAGGALDSFSPGAFKGLSRLKRLAVAEKLLKGKNLSRAEKAFLESSKFAGPLRSLEKAMLNPKTRRMVGGLEKAGSRAIRGGIWVSGKAARAQGVLDKVVSAGDKVHGALEQVHQLAPGLAEALGDNAAGHFVGRLGDWAGNGDEKLARALEYGHTASDRLGQYRGYLDKGLGFAGVKDPAKAYEKMMARKALREGRRGGLEHVARLKLEDHRRKHPELHLKEATRMRGPHREPASTRRRVGLPSERRLSPHDHHELGRPRGSPKTRLEQALARGDHLIRTGQRLGRSLHTGLGKVHHVLGKGLAGARRIQTSLEKASELARAGAGFLGDDSELGRYLLEVAGKADEVHGYLAHGIAVAEEIDKGVGKVHGWTGKIPAPLEEATHLGGKGKRKAALPPAGKPPGTPTPPPPNETEEQRSKRLSHAWDRIGYVSRGVQRFEARYGKTQLKIRELLDKGQANAASLELMGLGSECEEISKAIHEAKTLSKGHDKYEKEIKFYEEWHKQTKAKLHAQIAGTKGLGGQVAISGFGITESTHPDIFANTRDIYAVRTKVQSFGGALHDPDAHEHVKKLLEEAKKAKADLGKLKTKYRKDKAAYAFLTDHGEQDRLIDECIRKLEAAPAGESRKPAAESKVPGAKGHAGKKPAGLIKSVEGGLQAIDKFRKKAVKKGRKLDARLGKLEQALGKGIKLGRKVDSGLEKVAGVADQLSSALGEDSALGHFAHQVGEASGAGHEKLHQALALAQKGKQGLHKGREIFEQGLAIAAGEHAKKAGEKHRKKSPHGGFDHLLEEGREMTGDAGHLWRDGKKSVHDVRRGLKDAKKGWGHARGLWDHLREHDWAGALGDGKALIKDGKRLFGDGKKLFGDGKRLWHEGAHLLQHGRHLVGDVKKLFGHGEPGPSGAGLSEAEVAQVVQGAMGQVTGFGKAVAAAIKEIEGLMSAGRTKEAGDRVQAVSAISEQARFEVTRAVSASARFPALHRQAQAARQHYLQIRRHFFNFVKGLHGLGGQVLERQAGAHRRLQNLAQEGDRPLPPRQRRRHRQGPGHDRGVHVNRHGARRDGMEFHDDQDVDSAAADTWIGSGEGVKLFSEVFGPFLPSETALVRQHAGGVSHGRRHAGIDRAGGFFKGLFDHLHSFADRIAGWSRLGGRLLGRGMHYAEMGMHGLSAIEKAAARVQGVADKAEGFLGKMGLGRLAGFADKIGGAAGWVDKEAKLLHGGLKTADRWMGKGKKVAGQVGAGAEKAGGIFDEASHGRFGSLLNLFRAAKDGEGVDGKLSPEKVRLGSQFDEPRRIDLSTLSRMESFLGGSFAGVRIHTGPGAAQVTSRFAAEAVTVKDHIFFAPGRFNPNTAEGQRLLAHELTHVMQKGRPNLDVRTAEGEALRSEHAFGRGVPHMETLSLRRPQADFRLADGEGMANPSGVYTAKRNRSRGYEAGGKDTLPDGEEFLDQVSNRVYELLMEELEHAFESR